MVPAIGSVRTKKDGRRWRKTLSTAKNPIPFETRSSTRRSNSFVSMTKQSAARLTKKGGRSSAKMYRSRIVRTHTSVTGRPSEWTIITDFRGLVNGTRGASSGRLGDPTGAPGHRTAQGNRDKAGDLGYMLAQMYGMKMGATNLLYTP